MNREVRSAVRGGGRWSGWMAGRIPRGMLDASLGEGFRSIFGERGHKADTMSNRVLPLKGFEEALRASGVQMGRSNGGGYPGHARGISLRRHRAPCGHPASRQDRGAQRSARHALRAGAWRPVPYPLRPAPLPASVAPRPRCADDHLAPAAQPSERQFVSDLRDFWRDRGSALHPDTELFLLRNHGRGRGVGLSLGRGSFYPDFILWMIAGRPAARSVRRAAWDAAREGVRGGREVAAT